MLSRIMLFVGGLVVVALFAALLAPLFVDWTSFRQDFEREASRIMGRTVVVHGSVDARLIPFPSVTLNDVRVGAPEDGQPLVEVARFSMDAELAPFLSGEALIFDMRIEEPKARIRLFEDGTLDWARGRKSDIPARTVILENVTITGGEIEFVDAQTGRTRHVTGLDAQVSAKSLAGPWRIDGRAALDGESGAFQLSSGQAENGALSLRARIVPDRLAFTADLDGALKVVDFRPQYHGDFTIAEKPRPKGEGPADPIRVAGKFELSNERIRVPDYRLEAGPSEDPYVVTGEATLDTGRAPEFLLIADGQQIDVSRIGNNGEGGKTGRNPQVSARQRLQALLAIAADIPIPQVPGRASLFLPAVVVGDTTVREVRLDVKPDGEGWRIDRADALLPGRTTLEAKGRLTLRQNRGFVGDLLVASNQPSGLATWLAGSVDPEIRKLKTAGFSAEVNLTDELQRFENLEIAIGGASLLGRIERESRADAAPTLSLQLRGNEVALESLQALVGLVAGDASLSTVLDHSIALDVKADRFLAFGESASGVNAALSVRDGLLTLSRLNIASLDGAAVSASGTLGGSLLAPSAGLDMRVKAAAMRPVAELLARHLPAHPVLARFLANSGYYDNADLAVRLAVSGAENPATLTLSGPVNDGRVEMRFSAATPADLLVGRNFELEGSIFNPQSVVLAGQVGLDPLPFDADPDGSVTFRVTQPEDGPADVSAAFNAGSTTISIKGTAALSAAGFPAGTLALSAKSDDIEPYLMMNGIAVPQAGAGLPLALQASVATSAEAITITDIVGEAERNAFSGRLTLDRTAATLKGTGALRFDTVDFAFLAEAVAGPVTDPLDGGLNTAPLVQPLQDAADVSVALQAGAFWPGLYGAVEGFSGNLVWKGGELALTDMAGDWLGGRLAGRLKVANAEENGLFEARAELSGADLARIVWSGPQGAVAMGKADVTLAVDASGKSVRAMVEGASGSGEARLSDLTLRGLDTGALPALLTAADGIEDDITPERVAGFAADAILKGEAALGTVRMPFALAGGKLRVQSVTAGDGRAGFSGDADIDLAGDAMAGRLSVTYAAGEEALAGAEPEVVLDYRGLVEAPGVALDVQPLANYLSLRRFETERRRVETLQANVLEKQRLRREAALYRSRAEARATLAEAMRLQMEEEQRRRAEARVRAEQERAAREAAEAAESARRKAADDARRLLEAEEQARRRAEQRAADEARRAEEEAERRRLPVSPEEGVERGGELPPVDSGQNLNFDALPGVN
ncbi:MULTISPECIES: AsmA family protein [unclassified Shinella]|uniref:AsmA family protein n=1 Tax=unclassified Shinella TaxID=2643062 RepID=UPI00234E3FE7|nr:MULTISPECIES: AsmA family protein [unclassified Shinella]MCO5138636.1 AsmA family protein [Shinella sp.]MDC7255474.1 AsmA family protein [Shinella sp. YE25]